jgi:hypothetical protein
MLLTPMSRSRWNNAEKIDVQKTEKGSSIAGVDSCQQLISARTSMRKLQDELAFVSGLLQK